MSAYRESQIAAATWQRCHSINIRNPLSGIPSVEWLEQAVFTVGDRVITDNIGGMSEYFDKPTQSFPLLNPETQEAVGMSMTDMQLYVALYSRYLFAAKKRDKLKDALAAKKAILDQMELDIAADQLATEALIVLEPENEQALRAAFVERRGVLTISQNASAIVAYDAVMNS